MMKTAALSEQLPTGFTVTAHSGCMDTPDNSLASVSCGLQYADMIEVDVAFLPDGTPVLSHNLPAPTDAVTLDAAFGLLAAQPDKRMNLDLKMFSHCAEIQALAEAHGVLPQVFFTGVEKQQIAAVRAAAPKIPCYLNCDILPFLRSSKVYAAHLARTVKRCGAIGLNCNFRNATKRIVSTVHHAGLLVSLWTPNNEAQIERVLRLAPDNMTTRRPDLAAKVIANCK